MVTSDQVKTILLVEDEGIIALSEARMIQKHGYEVITVSSGEEAIETVKSSPEIDLVLMDINLGDGIDGTQAAEIILAQRELPVVFLSSHTTPEVVEKTEGITSYGYIVKGSGETVIVTSIKMAFKLFEANQKYRQELEDRQRSEKSLQKSEVRYRTLYENTPAMMHSIDSDGRLLSVSEQWLQTLGYTRDEVQGKYSTEFLTEASRQYAKDVVLPDYFQQGWCKNIPYQFVKKNGEIIEVLLSAISEKNVDGQIARSLAVIVDITERKQAEDALRKSEARFAKIFHSSPMGMNLFSINTGR